MYVVILNTHDGNYESSEPFAVFDTIYGAVTAVRNEGYEPNKQQLFGSTQRDASIADLQNAIQEYVNGGMVLDFYHHALATEIVSNPQRSMSIGKVPIHFFKANQ